MSTIINELKVDAERGERIDSDFFDTKQGKAKQGKARQSKAKQSKAKESKAKGEPTGIEGL